ncbi:fumarylacetoacetate hydrolase family protein [Microbacterium gilvum]|uniref:Fumarylacetoacetate hydrolase family protein n=1 Tax=Microbacterium gilvum TaxID=1336204 RepID=A0ABP9AGX2_9MICO
MRYVSFHHDGRDGVAEARGSDLHPLVGIRNIDAATDRDALANAARQRPLPRTAVTLRPVSVPAKVIGVGRNYPTPGQQTPARGYPILFTKFAQSLLAADEDLCLPIAVHGDYEGEIAVIIGKPGRNIPRTRAFEHVLGYALANDVSIRDYQHRSSQWLQGKAWDRSCPVGPAIVTPDEFDASAARLRTWINGRLVQDGCFRDLIYPVDELISLISEFTELLPGDIILTGSPHGNGQSFTPPRRLEDGDHICVRADGLGALTTAVSLIASASTTAPATAKIC